MLIFHKLFTLKFELFFVRKPTILKLYFQKTQLDVNLIKARYTEEKIKIEVE